MSSQLLQKLEEIARIVGKTPIVELRSFSSDRARVFLKLEYANPSGSHKDRIALYMLRKAVEEYGLREGDTVVEISSGNTAIAIAWMCRRLGLKAVFVVEKGISPTKIATLRLLGAEVIEVDMAGWSGVGEDPRFVAVKRIVEERGAVFLNQFENEANHLAHYETTGPEILQSLGDVKAFVMGIGTSGTITGVGRFLKEKLGNDVLIVGVVPRGSAILYGTPREGEPIEGLSKHCRPKLFEKYRSYIDRIVEIDLGTALNYVKMLAQREGILAGPSTGAALAVATEIAKEVEGNIVTIAADHLQRYPHILQNLLR